MSAIPKIIHYCWFGGNPLPKAHQNYIDTWKKFCPDFEIREWNESNFHPERIENRYFQEAFQAKQWAFVSDYARLKILYEHGGVYLDTDVEVVRPLNPLLAEGEGFIGFQNPYEINTGLGFAAAPFCPVVKAMLDVYCNRRFLLEDGSYNRIPCPASNTMALLQLGMKNGKNHCEQIQRIKDIVVYPEDYFNPYNRDTCKLNVTENTYTIHHYAESWFSQKSKKKTLLKRVIPNWYLKRRVGRIAQSDLQKIAEELGQEK